MPTQEEASFTTRPLVAGDRDAVEKILERVGNFSRQEQKIALELIDDWLREGEASD